MNKEGNLGIKIDTETSLYTASEIPQNIPLI